MRRFTVELLRESSSPCLRACSNLAQSYEPHARELFNAAFLSCWEHLNDASRTSLVHNLHEAFKSPSIPPEILQTLLNLAEFLEHDAEALPIAPVVLAELAQKSHAYAKALHYREIEFSSHPNECYEALININKKLDQYDSAQGVLKVVLRHSAKADVSAVVSEDDDAYNQDSTADQAVKTRRPRRRRSSRRQSMSSHAGGEGSGGNSGEGDDVDDDDDDDDDDDGDDDDDDDDDDSGDDDDDDGAVSDCDVNRPPRVREAWLAKLGHWTEALEKYDARLAKNDRDAGAMHGKLKVCFESLTPTLTLTLNLTLPLTLTLNKSASMPLDDGKMPLKCAANITISPYHREQDTVSRVLRQRHPCLTANATERNSALVSLNHPQMLSKLTGLVSAKKNSDPTVVSIPLRLLRSRCEVRQAPT